MAVGVLELRDRRRSQTTEWRNRVARTAAQIRERQPEIPHQHASTMAKATEENRLTPMVWCAMIVGGFSLLCGVAMFIANVVQFFR